MEKILTKALSEALTSVYSEELANAGETSYKFSSEFELRMRELICKTDRPISRYTGWIAAAACAVIAIGCAVLMPLLTDRDILAEQPVISITQQDVAVDSIPEEPEIISEITTITTKIPTQQYTNTSFTTQTPSSSLSLPSDSESDITDNTAEDTSSVSGS